MMIILMTSVKWQFEAMKLCALLKKPEFGGMFIAILMGGQKNVYGIISIQRSCSSQRKEGYLTACNSASTQRRSREQRRLSHESRQHRDRDKWSSHNKH
jgi:hypothetical protein